MLSLRGLQQDQNPATFPLSNAVLYFSHDSTVCNHSCCECRESNEPSVCHKLLSVFVTARASFCTDHRMSGLPLRHMYKDFKRIGEQTFHNAPTVCNSSFFELIVVKTWCRNLIQLLHRFVCHFAISFNAFLRMTFHVIIPSDGYRVRFCPLNVTFSVAPAEIRDSNIFLDSSTILLFDLHSR